MIFKDTSLAESFRISRNQILTAQKEGEEKKQFSKMDGKSTKYKEFKYKYDHLEECIEKFNNMDLVYFFREKSLESGKRYVVTSFTKDMAIMKRLRKDYSIAEICLMIEFLFCDEQDYLDEPTINILGSSWVNTIFKDANDWVDDKFIPHSKRKAKSGKKDLIPAREYNKNKTVKKSRTKIGEW